MSASSSPEGGDRILKRQPALAARDGLGLVWLAPWDGQASLGFAGLDPLYVEVCRRVRLVREGDRLIARTAGSKAARIEAKALTGRTGDPWAPVLKDGEKAYTPTGAGFGYRQIARLMNTDIVVRPVLATPTPGMPGTGLAVTISAVVRGQGKTEGFHERHLPVPGFVGALLKQRGDAILDRTGKVAQERADEAGELGRILRHALLALIRGGRDGVRLDDEAAQRKAASWQAAYDGRVEVGFFDDAFWNEVAERDGPHRMPWRGRLAGLARAVLAEAAEAAPRTEMRRIRARAQASDLFERRAGAFVAEVKMPGEAEPMTEAGERTARRAPSLSAQLRSISGPDAGSADRDPGDAAAPGSGGPGRGVDAVIPLLIAAGVNRRDFASDEGFRRWALICHLVATLAGTAAREVHAPVRERGADGQMTGPRHREREAGRRIHAAGVSETRLMRLTTAQGPALVAQVARLGRFLAAAGAVPLDLTPLAHLILSEGLDETRADEARLALARAYYAAEAGNDRDTDQIDEDARA